MVTLRIRPAILLFGDSITQQSFGVDGKIGWASLLSSDYTRRADVLNRGFSGYTTRHALEMIPRVFGTPSGDGILFCTIFFGANDAAVPGQLQHVPIEEYGENLVKIVKSIRVHTEQADFPIILMTPPPVDKSAWDKHCLDSFGSPDGGRTNEVTKSYGETAKVFGSANGCSVLDVFELMGGNGNDYGKYLSDGLHLSESGNTLVHEGLMNHIKSTYPDIAPMGGDGQNGHEGIPVEEKLWAALFS
jgi:isoamyl acetate esterase